MLPGEAQAEIVHSKQQYEHWNPKDKLLPLELADILAKVVYLEVDPVWGCRRVSQNRLELQQAYRKWKTVLLGFQLVTDGHTHFHISICDPFYCKQVNKNLEN